MTEKIINLGEYITSKQNPYIDKVIEDLQSRKKGGIMAFSGQLTATQALYNIYQNTLTYCIDLRKVMEEQEIAI